MQGPRKEFRSMHWKKKSYSKQLKEVEKWVNEVAKIAGV